MNPDHIGYHRPREIDDPQTVTLASTATDVTGYVLEPLTHDEAFQVVLNHIEEWDDDRGQNLRLHYFCACVDLGKEVPYQGFADLAEQYRALMTVDEADTWTQQLAAYLIDQGYHRPQMFKAAA